MKSVELFYCFYVKYIFFYFLLFFFRKNQTFWKTRRGPESSHNILLVNIIRLMWWGILIWIWDNNYLDSVFGKKSIGLACQKLINEEFHRRVLIIKNRWTEVQIKTLALVGRNDSNFCDWRYTLDQRLGCRISHQHMMKHNWKVPTSWIFMEKMSDKVSFKKKKQNPRPKNTWVLLVIYKDFMNIHIIYLYISVDFQLFACLVQNILWIYINKYNIWS